MILGKKIVGFDSSKNPIFKNTAEDGKLVGEIVLEKENGVCNICLSPGELTKDHVPPQCMGNKGKYHYINFHNYSLASKAEYFGIAQNGIQFKTVCYHCNNVRLKRYDDEIVKMVAQAKNHMDSSRELGFKVKIRPNSIIRGILGHLLAGQLIEDGSTMDPLFREAVLNPDRQIDASLGFYIFPHLTQDVRVLRNIGVLSETLKPAFVNVLKIFPFSFLVSDWRAFKTPHWHPYFDLDAEAEVEVQLFKIGPAPIGWPEEVSANGTGSIYGKTGAESIIGFRESDHPMELRQKASSREAE